MKKSLLALGAACFALTSMAAIPQRPNGPVKVSTERYSELKGMDGLKSSAKSLMKKAPAKAPSSADVITSAEGTRQYMTTTATGFYSFYGYVFSFDDDFASHVVYGDNDEVYFYDIIPEAYAYSYVKGVKTGDKVVIDLPQTILYDEAYDYGIQLCLLEYQEEVDEEEGMVYWYYYATDDDSVTFSVAEDGSMVCEGIGEDKILGYKFTDDDSWVGSGVTALSMVPFNEKVVSVPDDIEVSKNFWYANQGGYGVPVNWAQGYEEFYFQGLVPSIPDAWMMGSVEYDDDAATISIAQNQLIGADLGQFVYIKCAKSLEYDDYGFVIDAELMPDDYKYELVWNYEDMTIVSKDPEVYLIANGSKDYLNVLDVMQNIRLSHQDDFAGTPANPYGLTFDASGYLDDFDPYGALFFNVPAMSTEGDFLDTNNLYYVVYVDGEEWEFYADEYELEENMVEIPWDFKVYYIYNYGGVKREVDFFVEGITTLGVQSVYRYNGEETRSEIVTIDVDDPSAVATVDGGKKVASVNYYDVAGREVSNSAKGIVIKRVVYEDGSVAAFKKAVR